MSKAPGAAADYDGSGQWFKIKDWGELGVKHSSPERTRAILTGVLPLQSPRLQQRPGRLDHER